MKIKNDISLIQANMQQKKSIPSDSVVRQDAVEKTDDVKYSKISFGAIYNVKSKKMNIETEKAKLLRQLDKFLQTTDTEELDEEEQILQPLVSIIKKLRYIDRRKTEIQKEVERIISDQRINKQQQINVLNMLYKELKQLEQYKIPKQNQNKPLPKKQQDEKIDLQLLNHFKTAILEDNFKLKNVFNEYYKGLNDISTVEELREKYPKITVPQPAETVIAKKIESNLTRDFYEKLNKLVDEKKQEEIIEMINQKILEAGISVSGKCNMSVSEFYHKVYKETYNFIVKRFKQIVTDDSFSKIPVDKKDKTPKITENDLKLLSVDYDKFVLDVIRKQYIEGQKTNNITYEENGKIIQAGTLKEAEYKFEKISEKIKKIIIDAQAILFAQRDYDNFDVNQFKARLAYFANSESSTNEKILENIVDFDSCSFTEEDVNALIKFLRELDAINDEEKSIEKVVEAIKTDSLHPVGTAKLNELEKQKATQKRIEEQKKFAKLQKARKAFDEAINILYSNNLNSLANTCAKYRPESLQEEKIRSSEFIINAIKANIKNPKTNTLNKNLTESLIMNWDTYKYYAEKDNENPIFLSALKYAKDESGNVIEDKAGQYILNSEIIANYPNSLDFVKEPEILEKIIEKSEGDTENAVIALCKFDDYKKLPQSEQKLINKFITIFDQKNPAEKAVFRHITENEYALQDTVIHTKIKDGSDEFVESTFASKAKQDIISKYKYPLCLEFLTGFEDAMTSFAGQRGASGIKKTETNNKNILYKMEVKLIGHDDRLFSSKNDYYFDVFSDKGLH